MGRFIINDYRRQQDDALEVTVLKTPKKTIENIKKLNTKDKALLIVAVILTVSIVVTIPVMAWFSRKKQIAPPILANL